MNRIVDLNLWTPNHPIGKAEEFKERINTENIEFNKLWLNVDRIENASFIFKADIVGIKKWEELLKIYNTKDLSLEERRKQVYIEWNKRVIWTERSFRQYLDIVLGVDRYSLEINYNEYGIVISVNTDENTNISRFYTDIREIIPANLEIEYRIVINGVFFYRDKADVYLNRLWYTKEAKCGTIYKQQFVGKKYQDTIRLSNNNREIKNRMFKTNEIKTGGVKK